MESPFGLLYELIRFQYIRPFSLEIQGGEGVIVCQNTPKTIRMHLGSNIDRAEHLLSQANYEGAYNSLGLATTSISLCADEGEVSSLQHKIGEYCKVPTVTLYAKGTTVIKQVGDGIPKSTSLLQSLIWMFDHLEFRQFGPELTDEPLYKQLKPKESRISGTGWKFGADKETFSLLEVVELYNTEFASWKSKQKVIEDKTNRVYEKKYWNEETVIGIYATHHLNSYQLQTRCNWLYQLSEAEGANKFLEHIGLFGRGLDVVIGNHNRKNSTKNRLLRLRQGASGDLLFTEFTSNQGVHPGECLHSDPLYYPKQIAKATLSEEYSRPKLMLGITKVHPAALTFSFGLDTSKDKKRGSLRF